MNKANARVENAEYANGVLMNVNVYQGTMLDLSQPNTERMMKFDPALPITQTLNRLLKVENRMKCDTKKNPVNRLTGMKSQYVDIGKFRQNYINVLRKQRLVDKLILI